MGGKISLQCAYNLIQGSSICLLGMCLNGTEISVLTCTYD